MQRINTEIEKQIAYESTWNQFSAKIIDLRSHMKRIITDLNNILRANPSLNDQEQFNIINIRLNEIEYLANESNLKISQAHAFLNEHCLNPAYLHNKQDLEYATLSVSSIQHRMSHFIENVQAKKSKNKVITPEGSVSLDKKVEAPRSSSKPMPFFSYSRGERQPLLSKENEEEKSMSWCCCFTP